MATAAFYLELCKFAEGRKLNLSSLRIAESGGMHITAEMYEKITEKLSVPLYPAWGSTETAGVALSNLPGIPYKPGSVGAICPYYRARLINDEGGEVQPGKEGELCFSGSGVCSEYFHNPEETERHFKDGWVHTGDIFRRDEDGYFSVLGRSDDVLNVAGHRIGTADVENALNVSFLEHLNFRDGKCKRAWAYNKMPPAMRKAWDDMMAYNKRWHGG